MFGPQKNSAAVRCLDANGNRIAVDPVTGQTQPTAAAWERYLRVCYGSPDRPPVISPADAAPAGPAAPAPGPPSGVQAA